MVANRRFVGHLNYDTTECAGMRIYVIFADGTTGNVNRDTLDHLIRENGVIAFRRSEGWVQIGYDPIRSAEQCMMWLGNRRDDIRFKLSKP